MVTPSASDSAERPTHDVILTPKAGGTTVGLMVVDGRGKDDPLAISRASFPRLSTRIAQGDAAYSQAEPPYNPITQDDWSGGRASEHFEKDTARYMEGWGVDTQVPDQLILGGRITFGTGYRDADLSQPGKIGWQALYGSTRYYAYPFTASASYNAQGVYAWMRRTGTPTGSITAALYSVSAGDPNASLVAKAISVGSFERGDDVSVLTKFEFASVQALTASTDYFVAFFGPSGDDATNHWEVGVWETAATDARSSSDGSSWSADDYKPFFYVYDDLTDLSGKFFEYKRGTYFVTQPADGSASKVYLNGGRGTADDNTGQLDRLVDGTNPWTADQHNAAYVLVTRGPGSQERQPWRRITDTLAGALVVTPDWEIVHTTETEYIILGSNDWILKATLPARITDLDVTGDFVYFAYGELAGDNVVTRYVEHRLPTGVWTLETGNELMRANLLQSVQQPTGDVIQYGSQNGNARHKACVWKARVPPVWGSTAEGGRLHSQVGTLLATDQPWYDDEVTNVRPYMDEGEPRFAILSGFTTGVIGSIALPEPVSLRSAGYLGFRIRSSVTTSAGDLRLRLSSSEFLRDRFLADYLYKQAQTVPPTAYHYINTGTSYNELLNTYDEQSTEDQLDAFTTADYLYIGGSQRFDRLRVDVSSSNEQASVLSAEFLTHDGEWESLTITDGTSSSGATLGQDGDVTFTPPARWGYGEADATDLAIDAYWIRLAVSVNLTANTSLAGLKIKRAIPEHFQTYTALTKAKDADDGTHEITRLRSGDALVVGYASRFNTVKVDLGATTNDAAASLSAKYFDGEKLQTLTLTSDGTDVSGDTLKQDGEIVFNPPDDWSALDIQGNQAYYVYLYPSADLDALHLREISVGLTDYIEEQLPALTANEDTYVVLTLDQTWQYPRWDPDTSAIAHLALYLNTDLGAQNIWIGDDLRLFADTEEYIRVGSGEQNIVALAAYGDTRQNLWIKKEGSIFEMQDDIPTPVPQEELAGLRSSFSVTATNDVYLYFTIGPFLERLFNRSLDDIGPNQDAGLPADRQGDIVSLLSLPTGVVAGVDATAAGYSSALIRRGSGWHEIFRAPYGERLSDMILQTVPLDPGTSVSRIWISFGTHLAWIPFSNATANPIYHTSYPYTHEGHIITGWISAGLLDVLKLYKSFKSYAENLTSGDAYLRLDYQTETGELDSGWTDVGATFDTEGFQEEMLAANDDVTARRLRFRVRLFSEVGTISPLVRAWVIETLIRLEVKYSYTFYARLRDEGIDKYGHRDYGEAVATKLNQLDTWSDSPTALTATSVYSPLDGKTVVIEPIGGRPVDIRPQEGKEAYIVQVTLLEI